jgi:hypothetical protein
MQRRELICATIGVANTTAISGGAAADETNRGWQPGRGGKLWCITCSTVLLPVTVAFLFVLLATLPGRADDDKNLHPGFADKDKGIREEIAALRAQVKSLQATVSGLQNQVNALQMGNTTLQNQLVAIQSNHALLLGPFVNIDPNPEIGVIGPNIIFSGANIHIVSGSGTTSDNGNPSGLGNLIIGYDEAPPTNDGFPPFSPGDRGGSHNLVIGFGNRFTRSAFGGLVAGEANTISNQATCVSGGFSNTANGLDASVSGGQFNIASGDRSSVSGGHSNTASGDVASVTGGQVNNVSGSEASIVGGTQNTAGGIGTVVIGGHNVTDNNSNSIAPQPPFP